MIKEMQGVAGEYFIQGNGVNLIKTKQENGKKSQSESKSVLEELFELIKQTIDSISEIRKRTLIINWLRDFCRYILYEPKFKAKRLRRYRPGDILDVNFGYNVGSELSGPHFAVVVEENERNDGTVVVVPLSSYDSPEEVHRTEVDLGIIQELNDYRKNGKGKGTKARISHIRSISKLRIYYPKRTTEFIGRLTNEQLQAIYNALHQRYCTKFAENNLEKKQESE